MRVVGQSVIRDDVRGKVTGQATYPGDMNRPGQVYLKVKFSERVHAVVKSIDVSAAESLPGVVAVFTARDVPQNEYGLGTRDQPVLCGPGSIKPYADHVRCLSDQVALVAAESEQIAAKALKLIKVEYEDLPVVSDMLAAMADDAVMVHPERTSNVFTHYRVRKGDLEEAFRTADAIVEGIYHTPLQEHAYLQPEAGMGYIDEEGRVTIVVAGQWTHEDREQVAHSLNLPEDRVRIIYPAIGGAFGGREDMSVQILLGLAAMRLHERGIDRPVKIVWSREESIMGHHKRHPFYLKARWGANRDGKIVAAEMEVVADGGAYIYTSPKVLGNATLLCTGPYEIPNIKVDTYAVYTNNLPNGAFRGFGGPQGAFAAEAQMDKLAEKLGMDPVEIRMRNVLRTGSILSVGTPIPGKVSMVDVVRQAAEALGWKESEHGWQRDGGMSWTDPKRPYIRYGVGLGCSYKNVGFSFGAPEQCTARIDLIGDAEIDEAVVYHSAADVGQGTHSALRQVAAETLQIPLEKVRMITSDTSVTPPSGSVSASRMTFMGGNSVKGAAQAALEKWQSEERPISVTFQYRPPRTTPMDPETGKCEPNFAYGYVAESALVEVDTETGQVRLLKIICADDVGQAVNPREVVGQIEGAVVQCAGYTMMENFIERDGKVLTQTLSTYLIPTVLDIPDEVQSIVYESPDENGPYGARGMGEMPFLSLAPAITSAVHAATGVWFDDFPLTAERVLRGLGKI